MSGVKLATTQTMIIRFRDGQSTVLEGWPFHGCDDVVVLKGSSPRVVHYFKQLFRKQYDHPDARIIHPRQWTEKPSGTDGKGGWFAALWRRCFPRSRRTSQG